MLKMAHEGVTIGEIARQLSRSADTVHRHLAHMKTHCVRSDLWTDSERIELQSLIEDQFPVRAVAVILGRSHRSVRLKARGVCEPEPTRNLTMGLRTSTWIFAGERWSRTKHRARRSGVSVEHQNVGEKILSCDNVQQHFRLSMSPQWVPHSL
jgi:orotate phosphoribosyltransferase-like protein